MIHPGWKTGLKRQVAGMGLLPAVRAIRYQFRLLTDSSFRGHERLLEEDFTSFAERYGPLFRRVSCSSDPGAKRVLVVSLGSLGLLAEIALVKGFELAGYRPIVLTDYNRWMEQYYRAAGIQDIVYWDDFIRPAMDAILLPFMESVQSFEHLIKLDYKGARVGKYAASTALRQLRTGSLDLSSPHVRSALLPFLRQAIQYAEASGEIVRRFAPQIALSVDPGYTPRGELFDICLASGIDTITWNAAHKNNQLMLKRYSPANRDVHPASLANETWSHLQRTTWGRMQASALRRELVDTYGSGEWYSEVGTQFHTALREADEVRRDLALDPIKKTVVIFPHIFWDGTFFWGTDLFRSYEEWFVETMKVACANQAVNWVVKVHPANTVKNVRDGVQAEASELTAMRGIADPLPSHIRIVSPDSPMSTLSLYSVVDYCVTVRGTVGIEAAAFGIPVLTAGTGRYDRLGFTIDSESKAQYLDRLAHIQELPPLSTAQRELAERFAYGLFLVRPFALRTVTLEYQRDAKASLRTRLRMDQRDELAAAPDLRAFADWIESGREDFVAHPKED
ncbi:MAG: hypothetical protein AB7G68_02125 [Nitrospiraceae bacterium]